MRNIDLLNFRDTGNCKKL